VSYISCCNSEKFVKIGVHLQTLLCKIKSGVSLVPLYSVRKKIPQGFLTFFLNGWEFFVQILHAYYTFLFTLDYTFLFISNYDEVMPY